ncbi:MAG: PD40 domain-containing protein [Anaerolineae bacterium]|nr:PD40 domain-containing protein [Anaerolineae bacterium]
MRKQALLLLSILLLTTLACGTVSQPATSWSTPTPFVPATLELPQDSSPTLELAPSETPYLSPWPLPADLFYLNDTGQVWRQPYLGDESVAYLVTRMEEKVYDFAVAPGGEWIIYRTDGGVTVRQLDGSQGQVIALEVGTPFDVSRGRTLSWSPDAARVAYATATGFQVYIPGAAEDLQPLIFDAQLPDPSLIDLGWSANSRWLVAWLSNGLASLCDTGDLASLRCVDLGALNSYAWLIDGRLAFAPVEGGLALLDPEDLESRIFMVPQDQSIDLLFQRIDEMLAFFVHDGGIDQPGFLHLATLSDASFNQEGMAPIQTAGLSWDVAGGRLMGRGQSQSIAFLDPVTGAVGEIASTGVPVSLDWSDPPPHGVTSLPLAGDLYFLAPQAGIVQVWRLPADGEQPASITNAAADVLAYDVAPGSTQIAYTSGGTIYVGPVNSPDVKEMAVVAPDANSPTGTPAFSADGERLAYANNGIWTIDLKTGQKRRLVSDVTPSAADQRQVFDQPRWSPDGRWLLVKANFFQGYDYALVSVAGGTAPIFLNRYNSRAEWGADNMVLVYSDGRSFSQAGLSTVQPGNAPVITPLLDLPILDVALRPDGRLVFLIAPGPFALGPTSVQVYSAAADGADVRAETASLVLEQPRLSSDAIMVAGLVQTRRDDLGRVSGSLVVVNPATGQLFVLEAMSSVYDLQWSR